MLSDLLQEPSLYSSFVFVYRLSDVYTIMVLSMRQLSLLAYFVEGEYFSNYWLKKVSTIAEVSHGQILASVD